MREFGASTEFALNRQVCFTSLKLIASQNFNEAFELPETVLSAAALKRQKIEQSDSSECPESQRA